jgi:hypothetical protein
MDVRVTEPVTPGLGSLPERGGIVSPACAETTAASSNAAPTIACFISQVSARTWRGWTIKQPPQICLSCLSVRRGRSKGRWGVRAHAQSAETNPPPPLSQRGASRDAGLGIDTTVWFRSPSRSNSHAGEIGQVINSRWGRLRLVGLAQKNSKKSNA